jgi:hypothetical protein
LVLSFPTKNKKAINHPSESKKRKLCSDFESPMHRHLLSFEERSHLEEKFRFTSKFLNNFISKEKEF